MYGLTSSPPPPPTEAEAAPALLARFDALFRSAADADELVRAAARLAGCTAGLTDDRGPSRRVLRRGPAGGAPDPGEAAPSTRRVIALHGRAAGEVWIERAGDPLPFDGLLVERMALAAAGRVGGGVPQAPPGASADPLGGVPSRTPTDPVAGLSSRTSDDPMAAPASPVSTDPLSGTYAGTYAGTSSDPELWWPDGLGDPALVQAVLSPSMPEVQRSRALHLLGLAPVGPMRAAAVVVPEPAGLQGALRASAGALHAPPTRAGGPAPQGALWPRVGALLLPGTGAAARGRVTLPPCVAVGLGPAVAPERLPESWGQARRAARFAGLGPTWPRLMDAAALGAQALLADIPGPVALAHPDVAALARLEAEPDGAQMLATLEAVCRTRSLREAAKLLSLHHSSVAHRVVRAERALDMSLSDPSERQRAHTALLLWRLNAPDNWRS
ncbi:helix-turn-helix domain-containing protein [Streptomyces sp. Je 1-79]|uniref:helix-turn-helix domain-containing protein n=1 Tax=Streptomyces sp. Je 1-79 TaxID=2943847 RepID=UPI0021A2F988|nr:helix-turn-helix domain-containing protein [Streptomyces sp. Je 1-79]MCT4352586.1 helix-turn-helix domain-containing protein [Streptomyces sp. Je 1-79]